MTQSSISSGSYEAWKSCTCQNWWELVLFSPLIFRAQHQLEQTQVRPELGGGRKEFSMADADAFKDFEDTENFLSRCLLIFSLGLDLTYHLLHFPLSAERQSVLLHLLSGLRAERGESVGR